MKPFHFQQFIINQSKSVFRVGTDGVLLGALAQSISAKKIIEIGTGTGLISLMTAQRNPNAEILAIDMDENAVALAKENFAHSPFSNRLKAIHQDFNDFKTEEKFDFILSNPPYFDENTSTKDTIARQRIHLNFPILVEKSAQFLSENGIFSLIIPSNFTENVVEIGEKQGLKLIKKINIYGQISGNIKRHILEFSFVEKPLENVDFIIEKAPREYSEQYLEATKDFHIFNSKSKG